MNKERIGGTLFLLVASGWIAKDADERGQVEKHVEAHSAAAIRQLTTAHILGLGVDFTEGGKPEYPEKNPRSTGETNYNSTHMSSKIFENHHGAIPRWSHIQL